MKNNCKIIWIGFILFLITYPVNAQVKKTKQLTAADYHLWSTLSAESISDYGKWVSYSLSYEARLDTLFVKNTSTAKTFAFAKGYGGKFVDDSWFGCLLPNNRFHLVNLNNGKVQDLDNVQNYDFVNDSDYVILYYNGKEGKTNIVIQNLKGNTVDRIDNVISFTMNKKRDALGYCTAEPTGNNVGLLQFGKKITKAIITQSTVKQFENVVWKSDEKSFAFVGRAVTAKSFTADTVLYYVIDDHKLFQYDTTTAANWPKDMVLNASYTSSLGISDDGERVFFMMKKNDSAAVQNNSGIQVWNAADKDLFPMRDKWNNENQSRLATWSPKTGKCTAVGDSIYSTAILNGDQHFAIVYDLNDNKPSWKQEADRDYYLFYVNTGEKTLFLKKQPGAIGNLTLSPDGKYIAYFRDLDWWVYSIEKQTHTNTTKKTGIVFHDDFIDMAEIQPYGLAGWSGNDGMLMIYDQFDLWQINPENGKADRRTNGREGNQIFRIIENANGYADGIVAKGNAMDDKTLILKSNTLDNSFSGYFTLDKSQKLQPIVYSEKRISALHKANATNCYMYLSEDFNAPPSLIIKTATAPPKAIFQSNSQHNQYGWGSSKTIAYKNTKDLDLKGVLIYPSDYNPTKKYPMIVYIYQRQTYKLHTYSNPTLLNGSGFNASIFASQGYFILYPDIAYTVGSPGFSATDCVIAATNAAIAVAPIDRSKIGLTGHSFGGFETDFIMTQTDMFAAGIAGSAITDFVSCYLSVNPNEKKFDGWRFEYQQLRMGTSLFEDYERYHSNSPISYVSNITKPLFSYTGIDDTQVSPNQTIEFYLALRRLNKEHIMVLYPGDDHVIEKEENQIDLTNRITDWFGYYLKGGKRPEWFEVH